MVDHSDSRLESRVARIESDVANVRERISTVEVDLRDLRESVRSEISTLKIMIILVAVEVLATGWPRLYQDISGIPWHLK